jgi:transposase
MINRDMERYKNYEPNQYMWVEYRAEEMFPRGSYEEFLVSTLQQMDVSGFWGKADQGGEPPYHPSGMLGVIFYGISQGVMTSRKMERACRNHLGFMYVSGHGKPDHATICRFINEHCEGIKEVFSQLLYMAHEQGYLDYREIATDGTKIRANASKRFSGTIGDFEKRKRKLEEKIGQALEKLRKAEGEEDEYWERKKERYEGNKKKIEDFLKTARKEFSGSGKERVQNITDSDSRLMKMGKEYRQGYNAQISVCGKKGMIVAAEVVQHENDREMLPEMIEAVNANKPEGSGAGGEEKHLADKGYMSPEAIRYVQEHEVDVYLPMHADKYAFEDGKQPEERVRVEECLIRLEGDTIVLTCPGGRTMERTWEKSRDVYTFTAGATSNCEGCVHFKRCRGNLKGTDKKFEVTEQYLGISGYLERHRKKMQTDEARRVYSRRIDIVEKVFGHIKEDWGIRKMLRRTLPRVRCEWLFTVAAYNIRKLFMIQANKENLQGCTE